MKILIACALVVLSLSGCIAVPVAPEPVRGAYYYGPPPPVATFHFGYTYRDGGRWHGRGHRY